MSALSPRIAALMTGILSGLTITQAIAGHWIAAAGCALGAVLAGLGWRAARRAADARLLAALAATGEAESRG